MQAPIVISVFELFKVGPGPSSSHTIGPMAAAREFVEMARALPPETLARVDRLEVRLFGSLAATGRGHGSTRAVLAGLLGHRPETCPPDILDAMRGFEQGTVSLAGNGAGQTVGSAAGPADGHAAAFGPGSAVGPGLSIGEGTVVYDELAVAPRHPNTMLFTLFDAAGAPLFTREAHSVGGGFIEWPDAPPEPRPLPPHPFASMAELLAVMGETGLSLPEVLIENEAALTGLSAQEIGIKIEQIMRAMEDAVERGLEAEGPLPGPLGLHRKAKALFDRYRADPNYPDAPILALCACAFAAAEENAAGHVIVTAPTAGASGVLAAVLYMVKNIRPTAGVFRKSLRDAMLTAAVVGMLAKHNASVSGAEVGCQGEVGVASAMAAAFLCQMRGLSAQVAQNAAETALEHHLGLTCDPVGGYVQIPCIERNAMGAVKAYAAYQIAAAETPSHHLVGLDQAIKAMAETGRDMCAKYKETAQGGLAANLRC